MCFRPTEITLPKKCPECGMLNDAADAVCKQCGKELPDAPAFAGGAGNPGAPGASRTPGAPGVPSAPGAPRVPGAPSAPGAPKE